jgi:hypothetical protein
MMSVPLGTGIDLVSPAALPVTRTVSSALYLGIPTTCSYWMSKSVT